MSTAKLENNMDAGISCAECGSTMLVKTNLKSGHQFLGCSNYPNCKKTSELSEAVVMRLSGAPQLEDVSQANDAKSLSVCLHCGSPAVQKSKEHDGKDWVAIVCSMCGIRTPFFQTIDLAGKVWNRRFRKEGN